MYKQLLLVLLLSLALRPAAAQYTVIGESRASREFKQHLREQYALNDTAQAIINLYCQQQAYAGVWIQGTAIGALTSVFINGSQRGTDNNPPSVGARIGIAALVAVPVASYGIVKQSRYSNAQLNQVLAAYAAGQSLPRRLRRKLKRRFFQFSAGQQQVPEKPIK